MKKSLVLFLAFSITFIVAGNSLFFLTTENERENIAVKRAVDADTIEFSDGRVMRLLNINAPEKKAYGYEEASNFVRELENTSVEIEITGIEKYGRLLGRVYTPEYLNLKLVEEGHAHAFLVADEERDEFLEAQERAFNEGRGVWKRSPFYSCLRVEIDKKNEILNIEKKCNTSVEGWTIKDESTKTFKFPSDVPVRFSIFSAVGEDSEGKIYWGKGNVWNDDRDSIFIRDVDGLLVYYSSYGY